MKLRNNIGMDEWKIKYPITSFLQIAKQKHWSIYDVEQQDGVHFFAPISYRKEIFRTFEEAKLIRTSGLIGIFLSNIRQPKRIIAFVLSIAIWYLLSNTIFQIEIIGEKEETKALIEQTLVDLNKVPPFYEDDALSLKAELKKRLEFDVAWLEVSKQGSKYVIYYTPKEFADIESLERNELIAQKDGVIAGFELQHGNKLVKLDDTVKQGDVLVSNVLVDSYGNPHDIYVKGKVFAYTWTEIEVSMQDNDLPDAINYFELLLEARTMISKELRPEEHMEKENILLFEKNMGTIRLKIHYTLYEDITTP